MSLDVIPEEPTSAKAVRVSPGCVWRIEIADNEKSVRPYTVRLARENK